MFTHHYEQSREAPTKKGQTSMYGPAGTELGFMLSGVFWFFEKFVRAFLLFISYLLNILSHHVYFFIEKKNSIERGLEPYWALPPFILGYIEEITPYTPFSITHYIYTLF